MTVYGYCRCSTNEKKQDVQRQVRELRKAGASDVRCEYVHGDDPSKAELEALLSEMSQGDTLMVSEVSRLSRSVKQFVGVMESVKERRLRLVMLNSITVDCTGGEIDPMANAYLQMASVFSELELQMTRSRVRSGIENARAKGKRLGRPPMTLDRIPQNFLKHYGLYREGRINVTELAGVCGISRGTAYSYMRMIEGKPKSEKEAKTESAHCDRIC